MCLAADVDAELKELMRDFCIKKLTIFNSIHIFLLQTHCVKRRLVGLE